MICKTRNKSFNNDEQDTSLSSITAGTMTNKEHSSCYFMTSTLQTQEMVLMMMNNPYHLSSAQVAGLGHISEHTMNEYDELGEESGVVLPPRTKRQRRNAMNLSLVIREEPTTSWFPCHLNSHQEATSQEIVKKFLILQV
jgi:hypothetical protein